MSDLFPTLGRWAAETFPALGSAARAVGRGMKKLGRLLLYLLVLLLIVHIPATIITGLMLRRELSRIRDAGHALTTRELAPTVPAGERNAADVYQQAFDAIRLSQDDEDALFRSAEMSESERTSLARQVLDANTDCLALLDEASRVPACAFPVDWDAGSEMRFPHLKEMRQAAKMLALRAEVLAAAGDLDAAIASLGAAFPIAEHAKLEPILIGQLVAYAIQGIAVSGLEVTLSNGTPSADAARQLFDQLATVDQVGPFSRSMQGERTCGLYFFDFVRRAPSRELAPDLFRHPVPPEVWQVAAVSLYRTAGRPLLNLDELAFLHALDTYNAAVVLPWPRCGEAAGEAAAAVDQLPIYRSIITQMVFPVFARAFWSRDMKTARIRAAQIALALSAYHAEHDRYSGSLSELEREGWALPVDPFGGGAFHYRLEGDGFLVWSIGPDMDDDAAAKDYDSFMEIDWEERQNVEYDYDVPFRCQR